MGLPCVAYAGLVKLHVENTIRSGIWSGFSFAVSAADRMRSHAAAKSVEPPHPAFCTLQTFSD